MKKILITIFIATLLFPFGSSAETAADKYPRTANYYLMSGSALEGETAIATLSSFDLLVLPAEAQLYNKTFFTEARKRNPDIIILAYVPSVSYNNLYWNDALHKGLKSGIQSSWWLKNSSGNNISIWPGTSALNLTSGWTEYLAGYAATSVYGSGLWDGIFFDEVNDSAPSGSTITNSQWADGYAKLFKTTRTMIGPDAIIITNGSSNSAFYNYINGRMFESFPTPWEGNGDWDTVEKNYLAMEGAVGYDSIFFLNGNTNNTGEQNDYQTVRFGLTSSLLGGAYFGFDYGTESHAQLWEYDEYDAYLGEPKGEPEDLIDSDNTTIKDSVWARDFTNGKVVVNATNQTQTVNLDGEYEKLHGTQDPNINNGAIVSRVTLPAEDGLVLLRPIEEINNTAYTNGAFARIYDAKGNMKRAGFFAYDSDYLGGQTVVNYDIDDDGKLETITADKTEVVIYEDDGSQHAAFCPFTENYELGINLSVGDLEDDGSAEIVTGTEYGAGPQIRIFNKDGVLINPGFFAYDSAFRGGVHVTLGDVNGDGNLEIIAGAGKSGGPHVRIFNKNGVLINPGFFAYGQAFRGGVYVGSGDVDGDGQIEIVTGAGPSGGPHVRVYNYNGVLKNEFFTGSAFDKTGVKITVADVDDDGIDEIITLSEDVFTFSSF
ncbi:MAG: putative glycoside hydrolase [Patescibacteria group bacterium]